METVGLIVASVCTGVFAGAGVGFFDGYRRGRNDLAREVASRIDKILKRSEIPE